MSSVSIPEHAPGPRVRELRWSYVKGGERQHVGLSLDAAARAYEFRIGFGDGRSSVRLERYVYACDAIARQSEYEARLLEAGYSLDQFALLPVSN